MTTVGYGDDTPITVAGYLIATVCMFVGLVILALPITIIGANFDELYREMRKQGEHVYMYNCVCVCVWLGSLSPAQSRPLNYLYCQTTSLVTS